MRALVRTGAQEPARRSPNRPPRSARRSAAGRRTRGCRTTHSRERGDAVGAITADGSRGIHRSVSGTTGRTSGPAGRPVSIQTAALHAGEQNGRRYRAAILRSPLSWVRSGSAASTGRPCRPARQCDRLLWPRTVTRLAAARAARSPVRYRDGSALSRCYESGLRLHGNAIGDLSRQRLL